MSRRARKTNVALNMSTMNEELGIPDEIWEFIFLCIPCYEDLICVSMVNHRFQKLIRSDSFMRRYFLKYPPLFRDLIIYYNFSNVALGQNPFHNTMKSLKRGKYDNIVPCQNDLVIEQDSMLNYILKSNGNPVQIRNSYDLSRSRTILENCSFSFRFFICNRPVAKENHWLIFTLQLTEGRPQRDRTITIYVNTEKQLEFYVNNGGFIQPHHSNSVKLQIEKWYEITLLILQTSSDDTSIELYLDGEKLGEYKLHKRFRPPYHDITLEASLTDTCLSEIRAWKRKLTVKEIKNMFK